MPIFRLYIDFTAYNSTYTSKVDKAHFCQLLNLRIFILFFIADGFFGQYYNLNLEMNLIKRNPLVLKKNKNT